MRILWIVPETKGGIRSYADELWGPVRDQAKKAGLEPLELIVGEPRPAELAPLKPDLVHVQHEFGLLGSKLPGLNRFPSWIAAIREHLPASRIVATAHTVLGPDFVYPWRGRGWQTPLRRAANQFVVPLMRRSWIQGTWGSLDGVIVHSALQKPIVERAGCPQVQVIPHFVPTRKHSEGEPKSPTTVVVFGYFSPEKGQDVVIRAWGKVRERFPNARLVLAGGVRRPADRAYHEQCRELISRLGLSASVEITGYVPETEVDAIYERADLVVAPFRETSGSGSLAHALARGKAILASDLPLNREIEERESRALAFFRSEDAQSCAEVMTALLAAPAELAQLRAGARRYAERCSVDRTADQHLEFYRHLGRG